MHLWRNRELIRFGNCELIFEVFQPSAMGVKEVGGRRKGDVGREIIMEGRERGEGGGGGGDSKGGRAGACDGMGKSCVRLLRSSDARIPT